MSSLFDIFKKTSTLDPNKDYDFNISENSNNVISDEIKAKINELYGLNLDEYKKGGDNNVQNNSQNNNGNNTSPSGNSNVNSNDRNMGDNSTIESEKIKKLESEIANLKQANRQLANNTVVSSPDTLEDMIYNLCVGKEITNGSRETTSSTIAE